MTHSILTRRAFALGAVAGTSTLAACGNGIGSAGSGTIDARVDTTLEQMDRKYPNTSTLAE